MALQATRKNIYSTAGGGGRGYEPSPLANAGGGGRGYEPSPLANAVGEGEIEIETSLLLTKLYFVSACEIAKFVASTNNIVIMMARIFLKLIVGFMIVILWFHG